MAIATPPISASPVAAVRAAVDALVAVDPSELADAALASERDAKSLGRRGRNVLGCCQPSGEGGTSWVVCHCSSIWHPEPPWEK